MPSISEQDDAIFPDLPPPPPLIPAIDLANFADSSALHAESQEEPTIQTSKPRAKRTNWVAIGMDALKNNSIYALVKTSPAHPITAEFVRRHMQVNHQTYETPNPSPKSSGAWFSHIGRFIGDKTPSITGNEICQILEQLCVKFSFNELPLSPGTSFVSRFNSFFSGLVTGSDITFSIAPISLPSVAYIKPNDSYNFNSKPKRLASFTAHVNIQSLQARPCVTLSSCLSGLYTPGISNHNAEFIQRKITNFLYITSFICHHAYARINGIDYFADLQKDISIYRDNNSYSPNSSGFAALNFLCSSHCPDLVESDFRGCEYFTPIQRFINGIRIGSDDLYSSQVFMRDSDISDDEDSEDETEDEED